MLKPYFTHITSFILLMLSHTLNAAPTSHTKVPNWPILPQGVSMGQTTGVAVDSHNHVFVFHRAKRQWKTPFSDQPIEQDTVFMFDGATGQLKSRWGANLFIMPHGLSVDADDNVWVTDVGSHQVHKLSHDGKLLLSLGEASVKGDDAGHFARPTAVSFGKDGSVYVSDGYLNTRVVKFSASGKYISAWGLKADSRDNSGYLMVLR